MCVNTQPIQSHPAHLQSKTNFHLSPHLWVQHSAKRHARQAQVVRSLQDTVSQSVIHSQFSNLPTKPPLKNTKNIIMYLCDEPRAHCVTLCC